MSCNSPRKPKMGSGESFNEIESLWYQRLSASGFKDIESSLHPERPLKDWHSQKFISESSRIRQEHRERYNRQLDDFINKQAFGDICILIAKHGNKKVGPKRVKKIVELHRDGIAVREIGKKIGKSKDVVHRTLKKAREWMKIA